MLFLILLLVSLVACRNLLGGGALAGGALLPAPADASELWSRYLDAWHPIGAGGTPSAPPYLAIIAALATLLFGSTGLALTVLLVCSVPLAGLAAYFASRPLVESRLLRAWAAVVYAFLPAATGALAAWTGRHRGPGRTAAAHRPRGRRRERPDARVRRPRQLARHLGVRAAADDHHRVHADRLAPRARPRHRGPRRPPPRGHRLRPALPGPAGHPLLILAPWSLSLLPFGFFTQAGVDYGASTATALDLLGASPGGPGTVDGLMLIGIVLAALAALLRSERHFGVWAAWAVALVGLVFAILSNSSTWAGPATLVYGIALLAAAVIGADGARTRVAEQSFGWRQPVAALIAFASAAGPLLVAMRLDDRRRRRPPGAPRPRTGARVRRRGGRQPRPGPHPRPRQRLRRPRRVHAGPRLRRPPRRRRTRRGGRREQTARQGRRQSRHAAPAPIRPTSSASSPWATSSSTRARPATSPASWTPHPA